MPALALALLALAAPAFAHRPHQVVTALFAPADFDASGRAWAVLDPNRVSMLLRSDDHGRHWDFVGGAPTEEHPGRRRLLRQEARPARRGRHRLDQRRRGRVVERRGPRRRAAPGRHRGREAVGGRGEVRGRDHRRAVRGQPLQPALRRPRPPGESFSYAAVDAVEASRMAASTDPGGVAVSADSGQTWATSRPSPGRRSRPRLPTRGARSTSAPTPGCSPGTARAGWRAGGSR